MATKKEYVDVDFSGNKIRNVYGLTDANGEVLGKAIAIRPSLLLDFAGTERFSPQVSFARASPATRINRAGNTELVGANIPRIGYDAVSRACLGLRTDQSRANLYTNSVFSGTNGNGNLPTSWGITGASYPAVTLADGGVLGKKVSIRRTATTGWQGVQQNISCTGGQVYTMSAAVMVPSGVTAAGMELLIPGVGTILNISAATLAAQTKDVWVRYSARFTPAATGVVTFSYISGSGAVGDGFDVTAPQVAQGAFETSYIPTTTVGPVTRETESPALTVGDWYNYTEGTLLVEFIPAVPTSVYQQLIQFGDPATGNNQRISLSLAGDGKGRLDISKDGTLNVSLLATDNAVLYGQINRLVATWKTGAPPVICLNGGTPVAYATAATLPVVLSSMQIAHRNVGAVDAAFTGHTRKVFYYPQVSSTGTLQSISSI